MADSTGFDTGRTGAQDRLATLLELHGLALIGVDGERRIVEWSDGAAALFGYSAEQASSRPFTDLFTATSRSELDAWIGGLEQGRIAAAGPPMEWEAALADGRELSVRLTIGPLGDGFQVLVSAPPAGGALLKSEGFLRAVYDASDEFMILVDRDCHIVWSNAAWYRALGYAPGARKTPFDRVVAEDHDGVTGAWVDYKDGRRDFQDVSYRYERADGSIVWLETTIRPVAQQPYYYVRSRNVTERALLRNAEERRGRYLEATVGVVALTDEAPDAGRIAAFLRERLHAGAVGVWLDGSGGASTAPGDAMLSGTPLREAFAALAGLGGNAATAGDPAAVAEGALVPLVDSKGGRRGTLIVAGGRQTRSDEELAYARNLATTLSLALERQQYLDGLTRRAVTEGARADLGAALLSCTSEDEVLGLVLEFFERQYALAGASLLALRPGGLEAVLARVDGRSVPLSCAKVSAGSDLTVLASDPVSTFARLAPGVPLCRAVEAAGCDPESAAAAQSLRRAGDDHRTAVGLKIPGVGVVCGLAPERLVGGDLRDNAIVLDTVAAVVKQLRMEAARRRTMRMTEDLHQLEIEVRSLPVGRPKEKLRTVARGLARMSGAARVAILLRDDAQPRTLKAAVVEDDGRLVGEPALRRVFPELARHVCVSAAPVFVADTTPWGAVPDLPDAVRALADPALPIPPSYTGPIRGGGSAPVGALYVVGTRPYEDADFVFFHDIATIVSGALKDEFLYRKQRDLATKDELTGLYNRRFFLRRAAEWFRMARRYGKPFAVVLMDIDRFKNINDAYGHDCGDQALVELAGVLTGAVREVDIVARYGGEEFIVLLPETADEGAVRTAERIRSAVEQHSFECDGRLLRFTVSCGVAAVGEGTEDLDGRPYGVRVVGAALGATLPGGRGVTLELSLVDAADPALVHAAVSGAAAGSLDAREGKHLESLLRKIGSLEGMISIADGRLYRSKQAGRNRVTSGDL